MNIIKLILAIILVESGGDPLAMGDGGKSIGCMQIQQQVIEDVNKAYKLNFVWPDDAYDSTKSQLIFYKYVNYWGERNFGRKPTLEEAARIWNGGPDGYREVETKLYWNKVRKALDKQSN